MSDRETTKARLTVGLFVLGAVAVLVFLVVKLGGMSLRPRIHGSTTVPDATGLVPGARVTVAGVPVGQVRDLAVMEGRAQIHFVLYEGHGLTMGSVAEVRARSLLGEKYLAIEPAPAPGPMLASGFQMPSRPSAPSPDELMSRLARTLDALPLEKIGKDIDRIDAFLAATLPRLQAALEGADLAEIGATAKAIRQAVEAERPALHRAAVAVADVADAYRPGAPQAARDLEAVLSGLHRAADRLAEIDPDDLQDDAGTLRVTLKRLPDTLDRLDRTLDALSRVGPLLERLEKLDDAEIRRLLQEEGVRIRFSSPR